jgi:hypothetical protein
MDILNLIGHAIESTISYAETHHWIFGFVAFGYIFYLHDQQCTHDLTRSKSRLTRSESVWHLSIDFQGCELREII